MGNQTKRENRSNEKADQTEKQTKRESRVINWKMDELGKTCEPIGKLDEQLKWTDRESRSIVPKGCFYYLMTLLKCIARSISAFELKSIGLKKNKKPDFQLLAKTCSIHRRF